MALLLGIGHPAGAVERVAIHAINSSVVRRQAITPNLGDVTDFRLRETAVAQCQGRRPRARQIGRFPRFDEFEREGRWQPRFSSPDWFEMASQKATTPIQPTETRTVPLRAPGEAAARAAARARARRSPVSSATDIKRVNPAALRRSPLGQPVEQGRPAERSPRKRPRERPIGRLAQTEWREPAARNEPWRATARNTRTLVPNPSTQSHFAVTIRMCIGAHRICRSPILVRIN